MNVMGAEYPEHPRVAVGAVVFKDGKVLLTLRGNPPAQGMWAIPGGRVRLGETLQQAAEREIFEETGILIQAEEPVFIFETIERDDPGRVRFHYLIVDLAARYVSGEPMPGDDAQDARWVSPEEMPLLPVNPVTRDLLKSHFEFGPGGAEEL
jgi:ADP-ribose pyrophosphatase